MKNQKSVQKVLHSHIISIIPKLQRKAGGVFPYPWVAVSYGPPYNNVQAFWDAYHECLRFCYDGEIKWMRYMLDNYFYYQDRKTGYIPFGITKSVGPLVRKDLTVQPFVAQGAWIYYQLSHDKKWLQSRYINLKSYLNFFRQERRIEKGMYCWWYDSGCDNDVSTMFFPPRRVISVHVCSLLYLEYLTMAKIAEKLDAEKESKLYYREAKTIMDVINNKLWLKREDCYANLNMPTRKPIFSLQDKNIKKTGLGKYAFLSWNYLLPLYARIVPAGRAKKMIEKYLLNPEHFWSPYGIRSLSRRSEYYNNAIWGNPARYSSGENMTASNWQGPIWMPANYFLFHGLINYGYISQAKELINKIQLTLANGIRRKGCMFENYHAETGEPLYAPGFGSWNILADKMLDELEKGNRLLNFVLEG